MIHKSSNNNNHPHHQQRQHSQQRNNRDRDRSHNNHQSSNYRNSNNSRSSWENETPMHSSNRRNDATEDIIRRSNMSSSSSAAVVSRGSATGSRSRNYNTSSIRHYPGQGGETPMMFSSKGINTDNNNNNNNTNNKHTTINANQDEIDDQFDREFYDEDYNIQENSGGGSDGNTQMGRFLYESEKTKAREKEMERKKQTQGNAGSMTTMRDARKNALRDDQEAWEENWLLSSGAAVQGDVDLDKVMKSNEDDAIVTLLVHQVKPPFLKDGASAFSRVRTAVPTVRDNTSDFAKMAREGSVTLRTIRENKDKNAMRQKFWELGGTRMGNVTGVDKDKKEDEDCQEWLLKSATFSSIGTKTRC